MQFSSLPLYVYFWGSYLPSPNDYSLLRPHNLLRSLQSIVIIPASEAWAAILLNFTVILCSSLGWDHSLHLSFDPILGPFRYHLIYFESIQIKLLRRIQYTEFIIPKDLLWCQSFSDQYRGTPRRRWDMWMMALSCEDFCWWDISTKSLILQAHHRLWPPWVNSKNNTILDEH